MTPIHPIVFLVDVDNTLVDNDGIQQDLKDHLEQTYGVAARDRYWRILEDLMVELGYRDYIGALQRFRVEHPREIELLAMSSFLMDYPFANRLYPNAIAVLKRLRSVAPTVDSEAVKPGSSALVESDSRRLTPGPEASAPMRARSVRRPSTGWRSILKSPEWRTTPCGVWNAVAKALGTECVTGMNSTSHGPIRRRSPSTTGTNVT